MTRIKAWAVRLGLALARWGGWTAPVCAAPHLPVDADLAHVRAIVTDVQRRFADTSGDYRRREALRVLMNQFPQMRERDLNLLIEVALQ